MKKLSVIFLIFTIILTLSIPSFAWTEYCNSSGNEVDVYQHTIEMPMYSKYGGNVAFTVLDRCEWTVDKATKKFASCNYRPSSVAFTKGTFGSLWVQVGSSDAKFWVNRNTQKEATSAIGMGWGIGLKGEGKATSDGSSAGATLSVTVGQTAYYWGSTSINTIKGYSNKVDLVRTGTVYCK